MQTKLVKTALLLSVSAGLLSSCDSNDQTPPSERYEYKEDGAIVLDTVTKLEWMRCSLGEVWNKEASACEGKSVGVEFGLVHDIEQVINRGQSEINVSGATNWRVPNVQELRSLRYCTELDEAEINYISEQENKELKESLKNFVNIQFNAIKRAEANIAELEASKVASIASLTKEIEGYNADLMMLDEQLEKDLANLMPRTQQEKDVADAKVTELELSLQSLLNKYEADKAELENSIIQNDLDKQKEIEKHKSIIASVKAEFPDKLKLARKLKSDLKAAGEQKTTSDTVGLIAEKESLSSLVEFFENVYDKKASEISVISSEVSRLAQVTKELNDLTAQEAKDIEDLEREIANTINPEIEDLFESEVELTSINRRYFINETAIGSSLSVLEAEYNKAYDILSEQFEFSKLDKEDQLKYSNEKAKEEILVELENTEETLANTADNTAASIKIERHEIRKSTVVLDNLVDILEIESMDMFDQYIAQDVITDMPNIRRLENEVLTDFKIYTKRVAELQGTYPGQNDRVREPCGYLGRSPVRSYDNSEYKDKFVSGVWMLDETAFPATLSMRGSKVIKANGLFYWSSTELSYNELFSWGVNFRNGISETNSKAYGGRIRLVRDAD